MSNATHNILIADKFSEQGIQELKGLAASCESRPELSAEDLPSVIGNASVLLVRSTKVLAATIEQGKNLQLIVRAGAGVDNIDLKKAADLGIYVANCPGKNAHAVAELAIGLLLAADRRIPQATADLKAGSWNKKEYGKAEGLYGRTLGVLGTGSIGKLVIERARALGMRILVYSRSLTPEKADHLGVVHCPTPLELAKQSDAITIHLASKPETKGLIDASFFEAMKPNAILVNTSRGEIVDLAALEKAVGEKNIKPALDVYEAEPSKAESPFTHAIRNLPGFVGTPHIGASTNQAQEAIGQEAVRIVREFIASGHVPNCVNLAETTPAQWMLSVRHFDKVGVLAGIFSEIKKAGINAQHTNNIVFAGAEAAVARIELDASPSEQAMNTIRTLDHVLSADVVPMK